MFIFSLPAGFTDETAGGRVGMAIYALDGFS